jgi:hypothetical protein
MSNISLRIALSRVAKVATILAGVALILGTVATESVTARSRKWAESLSKEDARAFVVNGAWKRMPVEYRRALYSTLGGPADRAEFWRAVLDSYRASGPFSPEQSAVLDRVRNMIQPSLFSERPKPETRKKLTELASIVRDALGPTAVKTLFQASEAGHTISDGLPLAERIRYGLHANAVGRLVVTLYASGCRCSVGAYPQGQDEDCGVGGFTCVFGEICPESEWTSSGCGPWWLSPCDGTCGVI